MLPNIMVIRSGNLQVMSKLFEYLYNKNADAVIYCLSQENMVPQLHACFPKVNLISTCDGFFDYRKFKKDMTLRRKINLDFDYIYIPSSTMSFKSYLDICLIVSTIKVKNNRYSFFCCDGFIIEKRPHRLGLLAEKYFSKWIFFLKLIWSLMWNGPFWAIISSSNALARKKWTKSS